MITPINNLTKLFTNKLLILTLVATSILALTSPIKQIIAATDTQSQTEHDTIILESDQHKSTETVDSSDKTHTQEETHEDEENHASGGHGTIGPTLLVFATLLFAAKIGGAIEKYNIPRVLGELTAGVFLSILALLGLDFLEAARNDQIIIFLAEFGVILLLFEIGLESNIKQLIKVGPNSLAVALIGAVAPFVLGTFIIGPWLFPQADPNAYLFIGATLVATSVGISASIFQNLGKTKTRAFQTFLGATLTDDVIGLVTLAVVSSIVTGGNVTPGYIGIIIGKALAFLGGAIIFGSLSAKHISHFLSKIHTGTGMKLGLAVVFAIFFAYLATLVGLAPIIGAFAAGLVLDSVHFDSFEAPSIAHTLEKLNLKLNGKKRKTQELEEIIHHVKHTHIEDMVQSLSLIFVPLFFTFTGLLLDAKALLNPKVYFIAIVITVLAVAAKVIGGLAAKGTIQEKLLVGFSMAPRGEVGLIFATMGKTLGVFNAELFSAMVMVTFLTTFAAIPPIKSLAGKIKAPIPKTAPDLSHGH